MDRTAAAIESLLPAGGRGTPPIPEFARRLKEGCLTRDENPLTHFCVYFAAHDPGTRRVFLGHHRKSGLWLFSGGHIDRTETPGDALVREIWEEWGMRYDAGSIGTPSLFTVTDIVNPSRQTCRRHYDIWYFIPVGSSSFSPDQGCLNREFHETKWLDLSDALGLASDPATREAVSYLSVSVWGNR